jgi:hypothetical protein
MLRLQSYSLLLQEMPKGKLESGNNAAQEILPDIQ